MKTKKMVKRGLSLLLVTLFTVAMMSFSASADNEIIVPGVIHAKVISDWGAQADDYQFAVTDSEDGTVIATATNDTNGNIRFDFALSLTADELGTVKTYIVKQTGARYPWWELDKTEHQIKMVAIRDNAGSYLLQPLDETLAIVFDNILSEDVIGAIAQFDFCKVTFTEPLSAGQFWFDLYGETGEFPIGMSWNDADGNLAFALSFTMPRDELDSVKTFTVKQGTGYDPDIIYDTREFEFQAVVVRRSGGYYEMIPVDAAAEIVFENTRA